MPINLTLVSPSSIGKYGACPWRLVGDSMYPDPDPDRNIEATSFGRVAHWHTMRELGCPPPDMPGEEELNHASRCADVRPQTREGLNAAMGFIAPLVANVVKSNFQIPASSRWLAEQGSYNLQMMPERVGRKGNLCGFGGSIDLLDTARTWIVDLKFVNPKYVPEIPSSPYDDPGISLDYLWQITCYHILEGIPKGAVLWAGRDGRSISKYVVDFSSDRGKHLVQQVSKFIDVVQYKNFESIAWAIRGKNCTFCHHKGVTCPAWTTAHAIPVAIRSVASMHAGQRIAAIAAKAQPVVAPPPPLPAVKGPPPVPVPMAPVVPPPVPAPPAPSLPAGFNLFG